MYITNIIIIKKYLFEKIEKKNVFIRTTMKNFTDIPSIIFRLELN